MEEPKVTHVDGGGDALRAVYERLCQVVGPENVSNKKFVRQCYSRDASSIPGRLPDIVVQPSTTEEVRQILLVANETHTPVYTRGSGSGLWGGCIPYQGGIVLDCAGRLNKFVRLDEKTLTCVVQPGLTFGELEAELKKHGYRERIAPEGGLSSAVGGHFATHGVGFGSGMYGNQGDAVMGIEVVLPNGDVVRTGSQMNPNAHGHFFRYSYCHDLTGLFCGSEGTLGVITELALMIEKIPEGRGFSTWAFHDVDRCAEAVYRMRAERVNLIFAFLRTRKGMEMISGKPSPYEGILITILEGPNWRLQKELELVSSICKEEGGIDLGPDLSREYWFDRFRHGPGGTYKMGSRNILPGLIPLRELGHYYWKMREILEDVCTKYGFVRQCGELGQIATYTIGGFQVDRAWVLYPNFFYNEWNPDEWPENVEKASLEATKRFVEIGFVPYRMGGHWPGAVKGTGAPYQLIKSLKEAVDPNGIMNPGIADL